MGAKAQQIKLRLFLEGVESPIISAQVVSQPNAPAQAAIQIPPTSFATKLLPRTVVHLFFIDPYAQQNPALSYRGADQRLNQADPTAYEQSQQKARDRRNAGEAAGEADRSFIADMHNSHYKLLFAGEVHGFQWTKDSSSRSVVLQCVDFSNYWDYAWQFQNTDVFGPGYKALFSGGASNLFTDLLEAPGQTLTRLLHERSVQYPGIKGFLGGLIRMLEGIGGSYYYDKKFQGQNTFYSIAELRLHITQMIAAYSGDDTAYKLLNAGGYDGLFGRTLGDLGEQVSIRKALMALMGIIFYETQPIPTPYYIPGSGGSVGGQVRKKLRNNPQYGFVDKAAAEVAGTLEDIKKTLRAPAVSGYTPSTNPKKDKQALLTRLSKATTQLRQTAAKSKQSGLASAVPGLSTAATVMSVANNTLKKSWQPDDPPGAQVLAVVRALEVSQEQLEQVRDLEADTYSKNQQIPARLCTQVFKPDVWFSAPPRCNVLFPDNYFQLNYSRSFMQEPTRFLLKTNDEFYGEDILFDQFYFAPRTRTVKGSKKTLQALLQNDVMDHELFTGVLPVFEKMGELNIFAVRSGTVKGKTPKIGLAQRSANFLYFKHRFAARDMSVSARFNPYLAPGFPALVIDKYVDPSSAQQYTELLNKEGRRSPAANSLLGTHFLGNITQLTHTVTQSEGRTDLQLSFAREYDEITEFLGPAIGEDQEVQQRFGEDALRETIVAAISTPPLNAIGPNYGVIDSVTDVTSNYRVSDPNLAFRFYLWTGPRRQGNGQFDVAVPVGVAAPASEFGPEVVELVGSASRYVQFNAYKIKEKVPRYRRTVIDLPAEELIRPGWYGDVWHPSKVGEVYLYLLGTGAVTDKTQVSDAGTAPPQDTNADITDGLTAAMNRVGGFNGDDFSSAISVLALDKDSSIEQAVQFLLLTYSYIRSAGLDADEFIRAYTWRPIATMVDLFGTSDLRMSDDGTQVLAGIEGFHSRAFGPYNDLFGLVTPDITEILDIKKVDQSARQRADVRGRRYAAVVDYVNSLQFARALVG